MSRAPIAQPASVPASSDPAPASPAWRVRILDLCGGAEEGVVEEVGPFPSPGTAAEFAACYIRDSIEHCRRPGAAPDAVRTAWSQFGEDAEVIGSGEAWRSADHLDRFFAQPATAEQRDWRSRDPRRSNGRAEPEPGGGTPA